MKHKTNTTSTTTTLPWSQQIVIEPIIWTGAATPTYPTPSTHLFPLNHPTIIDSLAEYTTPALVNEQPVRLINFDLDTPLWIAFDSKGHACALRLGKQRLRKKDRESWLTIIGASELWKWEDPFNTPDDLPGFYENFNSSSCPSYTVAAKDIYPIPMWLANPSSPFLYQLWAESAQEE